jgi:eukaryotic-like serine/threonine-protein kinase
MGEVYRARDSRLRRAVAIKVLPASVARDRDRLERLQREATTLASLNHPNIAQVYGLEPVGESAALVMELIDGEELSARIGRVSTADAVGIAAQIASALEAAHAAGVIHRDLKPANIMIRGDGTVRILDFGLAKIDLDPALPTITDAGLVLGTVAYMAPEQARGQTVDTRCDIWAFGCVLYELLTGRRAFDGQSAAEAIAAVLEREPDWNALPAATPPALRALLSKCLQKDRSHRLRDIGDAHFDLDEARGPGRPEQSQPSASRTRWSRVRESAAWAAAIVAILLAGITSFRSSAPNGEVIRFAIAPPENETFGSLTVSASVSPNGRHIAFVTGAPGSLWVRSLDQPRATRITGTEGALTPFWSPDSSAIGFFADRRLMRTDLAGIAPQLIARVPPNSEGAAWGANGTILFGTNNAGIFSVPASGGNAVAVTTQSQDEGAHHWPVWLTDHRHFLYRAATGMVFVAEVGVGAATPLLRTDAKAEFVAPDIVLFVQGQDLLAQRVNMTDFTLRGTPTLVASQLRVGNRSRASFSSSAGTLLYRHRPEQGDGTSLQVLDGAVKPLRDLALGQVRRFTASADGRFLAVHAHETNTADGEVWIVDVRRGSKSRTGLDGAHFDDPVWSPDGTQIVVSSGRKGLFRATVGVGNAREPLYDAHPDARPSDWTRDGKWIIFQAVSRPGQDSDIWGLPTTGPQEPQPLVRTPFDEGDGVVSPDGRWLAYTSNESGRREVYLQPFPGDGRKQPVSIGGGAGPRWDDKGRLYYWSLARQIVRVTVTSTRQALEIGEPEPLFQQLEMIDQNFLFENGSTPYAILPNGKGYIRARVSGSGVDNPMQIVTHWQSLITWRD